MKPVHHHPPFPHPLWKRLLIPLACLASVLPAFLAAQPAGDPPPVTEFTFQTLFLAPGGTESPELYYRHDDDFRRVSLQRQRLGPKQTFRGPIPFDLYEKTVNEEGQTIYVPAARLRADFPSTRPGHQILVATPGGNAPLRLQAIAAGSDSVEAGQILVLNASSFPLAARVGDGDPQHIAPANSQVVDYNTDDDSKFRLEIAANEDDEWKLIHSASLTQVRNRPLFLVVYPNSQREGLWNVSFLRLNR